MQNPVVPVCKMRQSVGVGDPRDLGELESCHCDGLWLMKN